jgi:uncharacterized membrane protein (UPF0127 family)
MRKSAATPSRVRRGARAAYVGSMLALTGAIAPAADSLPKIELRIGAHKLVAETAATEPARALGLMHRKQPLADNHGMLFVFAESGFHGMWMRNTYIPLSVAFIDESGIILNIADMTPLTTTPHTAAGFAKYALEMNQGWFAARSSRAGAKVEGLAGAPAAR